MTDLSADACVIGGGFCGAVLCAQLVRQGFRGSVILIESRPAVGPGLPYAAAPQPADATGGGHLLNVPVRNMGAWPDQPADFGAWLESLGRPAEPTSFAPRAWYGEYLSHRLREAQEAAGGRLSVVKAAVVDVGQDDGAGWIVALDDGRRIGAGALVLATGHQRPEPPSWIPAGAEARWWRPDPWTPAALAPLQPGERVLIIGAGLTMVDVCLSLTREHADGDSASSGGASILAISRHGLLPRPHGPAAQPAPDAFVQALNGPELPLRRLVSLVAGAARTRGSESGGDWRPVIDAIRPHAQRLWAGLRLADRRRFLRHVRALWDVHRHRLAPRVAMRIEALRAAGVLRVRAGRILGGEDRANSAVISWRPRGATAVETGEFERVIHCTGTRSSIESSPLLSAMSRKGLIRPDALGLGVDTDAKGRLLLPDGRVHARAWALGPLRRGTLWENTAAPELRGEALDVARQILGG